MTNAEIVDRYCYHKPTEQSVKEHEDLRIKFIFLASYLDGLLPNGREKSLAHTALQEASMWAHAAVALEDPVV